MLFLGYISYQSQKIALTEQVENNLKILSFNLAIEVEDFIRERLHDVELLAQNPVLKDENSSLLEIREQFNYFLDLYPFYFTSAFVNQNGIVTVDMDEKLLKADLKERVWFQHAIQGETYFSDIYFSSFVNTPLLVIAVPVRNDQGEIIGVLAPSLDLNFLWKTVDHYTSYRRDLGLSGYAFLMNNKGEFIAHPDRTKILKDNLLLQNNLKGLTVADLIQNNYLYYSQIDGTMNSFIKIDSQKPAEWYAGYSIQKEELYGPLNSLLSKYIILFGFVMIVVAIVTNYISKSILRPLNELVTATENFSMGEKVKPLSTSTYKEIDTLNTTFNKMVQTLEERDKRDKKSTLIIETADSGILGINKATQRITTFNKKSELFFNISKENVIGETIDILRERIDGFEDFLERSSLQEFLETKKEHANNIEFNIQLGKNKYVFLADISTVPAIDQQDCIEDILIAFSNITEKRRMENELLKSEKLKIAGQLAAGFVHEFRNPLTTIKGFIQLFSENRTKKSDHGLDYYQLVIQEIDRLDSIVTNFLAVTKPDGNKYIVKSNLNELIEEMVLLYQPQGKKLKITVTTELEKIPLIEVDPKQMKQVFVNIFQNAYEAMPDGGNLKITSSYFEDDRKIRIYFSDNGIGMDDETLQLVGTPFFSTKETGTGLGITTIQKIIKEMDGQILIESSLGEGTTVVIEIPVK